MYLAPSKTTVPHVHFPLTTPRPFCSAFFSFHLVGPIIVFTPSSSPSTFPNCSVAAMDSDAVILENVRTALKLNNVRHFDDLKHIRQNTLEGRFDRGMRKLWPKSITSIFSVWLRGQATKDCTMPHHEMVDRWYDFLVGKRFSPKEVLEVWRICVGADSPDFPDNHNKSGKPAARLILRFNLQLEKRLGAHDNTGLQSSTNNSRPVEPSPVSKNLGVTHKNPPNTKKNKKKSKNGGVSKKMKNSVSASDLAKSSWDELARGADRTPPQAEESDQAPALPSKCVCSSCKSEGHSVWGCPYLDHLTPKPDYICYNCGMKGAHYVNDCDAIPQRRASGTASGAPSVSSLDTMPTRENGSTMDRFWSDLQANYMDVLRDNSLQRRGSPTCHVDALTAIHEEGRLSP
ncbi:hypothetical protein B0I35DRAFT_12252 [Stachybotrys elegans]|uniref:CCHC-type domain-containing protein n=1 Tax=Stachybotrys elegans TaxID=80388 RepID=A0A8K0T0X3_9HYPO|nr:hypothetical protein B0I35DRAFT_12252 [Stachybotrys elegans]